jgi:TonB-dependent receptor
MARWAPEFGGSTALRREHPVHPLLSLNYQEVFGVFGRERNLGVSFSAFYSENVNSVDATILDYQNTTATPAYVWDFRRQNTFNNRTQRSASLKFDYKVSDHTRVFFNTIFNDAPEKFNRLYTARAFSSQSVAALGANGQPTGTNPILPGYTDTRTEVRPVNGAVVELNSTLYSFLDSQRQFHAGAEHEFDRLRIDYDANYSHSKPTLKSSYRDNPGGGIFTMQARSVGWVLDKAGNAVAPDFTQTAGPSIYDPASYGAGRLTNRNNERFTTIWNASATARYALPADFSPTLKAGVRWRNVDISERAGERRWDYVGAAPLTALVDQSVDLNFFDEFGGRLPFVESASVGRDILENPQNWAENEYYAAERKYVGTRSLEEDISAAFVQGSARFGPLNVLGGLRVERTEVAGTGYIASRVRTTTAERAADPVGAAAQDYAGNLTTNRGSYTDWFPGVHLVYRFAPNLQGRASWSNSVGRPSGTNLIPSRTFNDTNQTVSISNPSLKPQYAENWDLALEYYFEPVGQLSAGVFRKDITDFIISNIAGGIVGSGDDNGFEGDFAGYEIRTSSNGGFARVEGYELNYQQQFTFLPRAFRGLGFSANYTRLKTTGDYGGTGVVGTNEVANFVPETANAVLSYKFGRWNARVQYNYMSEYLTNAGTDARQQFRFARELVNIGFGYQWRKGLAFSFDIVNVFNEPQQLFRGYSDRLSNARYNGTAISFGISGTF